MLRVCRSHRSVLAGHPAVDRVYFPGLADHPQHEQSKAWFKYHGAILSFELRADLDCFDLLDAMNLVVKATHLGDLRTLALPVAHTIFYEVGPERRAQMELAIISLECRSALKIRMT